MLLLPCNHCRSDKKQKLFNDRCKYPLYSIENTDFVHHSVFLYKDLFYFLIQIMRFVRNQIKSCENTSLGVTTRPTTPPENRGETRLVVVYQPASR